FALARMSSPRLGVGVGLRRGGTAPRADRMSRGARSRRRRNLPGARTHLRAGRTRKHLRCLSGEGPDLLRGCLRSHLRRLPGWLELVDANTLEVFDERWSGVFDTLSPGDRFVFVDRKSTRLNSSHVKISYAVFCLKKKTINRHAS